MSDDAHAVAVGALAAYDLDVAACTFAAQAFNTVFRVETRGGDAYALRVGATLRIHAEGCEELETAWVNELHADGLQVARAVAAPNGDLVVDAGGRRSILFEWVDGRPLREGITAEGVRAAGALAARVHAHAVAHRPAEPPAGALVADRVLYFRVDDRLDELRPAYGSVVAEALERAQRATDALWRDRPHEPHLLHGDIQTGNVIVEGADATLIDFQDLAWGFEVQEVAIAFHSLAIQSGDPTLPDAFRAGYETVRPWPDADPATRAALVAARHLHVLNLGLNTRKPGLDEFVARHAGAVVDWMAR